MKATLKQSARRFVGGSMVAALAMIGFAVNVPQDGPPGLPLPTLPNPDPTAPPMPGGGG